MRKRRQNDNLPPARMLSIEDLADYLATGSRTATDIGSKSGARRKIGRRVVYDRVVIDRYLDGLEEHE